MSTDPELKRSFRGHKETITAISFNPNTKQIASSSIDSTVVVWSFKPDQRPFKFFGHKAAVYDVAFSPNGQVLASASKDETVRLWQNSAEGHSTTIKAHTGPVQSVSFSPDGKLLVSTSDDRTAKVWSAYDRKLIFSLGGHQRSVRTARFSPDIRLLATGSEDKTVKVWDVRHKQELQTFYDHDGIITDVKFHPDGACLASCGKDKKIKLYDIRSRTLLQHYDAHAGGVNEVAFHPTGNFLVSASDDSKLKVWDLRQGKLMYTLYGHGGESTCADFSAKGDYFASGGSDKIVMVWKSNFEEECLEHIEDIIESKSPFSTRRSPMPSSAKKNSIVGTGMESPKNKSIMYSPKHKGTVSPFLKAREKINQAASFQHRTQSEKKKTNEISVRKHRQNQTSIDFSHKHKETNLPKPQHVAQLSDILSTSLDQIGSQLMNITKSIKTLENKLENNESQIAHLMHTHSPIKPILKSESKEYGKSYGLGHDHVYSAQSYKYSAKSQPTYGSDNDENAERIAMYGKRYE